MELELGAEIFAHKTEKLDRKSKLSVNTSYPNGMRSNRVSISIQEDVEEDYGYLSIELNKNQALHLYSFLKAFVDEKDIDIEDED